MTVADLVGIRKRLRSASALARIDAVTDLRLWLGSSLDRAAASESLRAAAGSYPWVAGVPDDPAELFVQLVWADPHAAAPADLERTYLSGTEGARRATLRLWALRSDPEAVDAIEHLIGFDGPVDLLPTPSLDLLMPILDAPGVERLAGSLVRVAWRRGWSGQAASLLAAMFDKGLIDHEAADMVVGHLGPLVSDLVDACDRAIGMVGAAHTTRADLERLGALLALFGRLPGEHPSATIRRALSAADPRVGALAVIASLARGDEVAPERIGLVARDPEARAVLLDGLVPIGADLAVPVELRSHRAVAEADLVSFLAQRCELGRPPDEMEHRAVLATPAAWGRGAVHVFAFRVRPPHWGAARGWMLAAVGPYEPVDDASTTVQRAAGHAAHTLYETELCEELERHVLAISEAVVQGREADEAA